jgi:hypothetical protein
LTLRNILWVFGISFIIALVLGYIGSFLDIVLTAFLGLAIGVAVIANKIGKGRGYAAVFFLSLLVGYVLFLVLPIKMQLLWAVLSLAGQGDQLNIIAQTQGIRAVATAVYYSVYLVLIFNVVAGSLGYIIALLGYKSRKHRK